MAEEFDQKVITIFKEVTGFDGINKDTDIEELLDLIELDRFISTVESTLGVYYSEPEKEKIEKISDFNRLLDIRQESVN